MEDYIIVDWSEIQDIMDEPDFEENATLINPNDYLDIGSSTYLVNKEWYNEVTKIRENLGKKYNASNAIIKGFSND